MYTDCGLYDWIENLISNLWSRIRIRTFWFFSKTF